MPADPFDVTNSEQPAANGGLSPDFYRNLMTFGAGGLANSNLPGATAFGKGILTAQEGARANSVAQSENASRAATTASTNMSNSLSLMNMNMLRQHYNMPPLSMGPNGQLQVATQEVKPASTSDKTATPRESQGMTGASWAATPGTTRLNSGSQTNAYPAGSSGTPAAAMNPMMGNLVNAESGGDPNAVSSAGAGGLTQIMPSTARDPGYGVQPLQGWDGKNPATAAPQEQMRFGNDYLNAMQQHEGGNPQLAAAAYNAGPGRVDQALQQLPQETQDYVQRVAGQQQQPPQAQAQAQQSPQQSGQFDPYAAPPGVDKAKWDQALMLNNLGNPYGKASLEAMGKAPYNTIEARQGGIAYNPGLGITAVGRLEGETPGGAKYLTPPNISGPNGQPISGEPANKGISGSGGEYSGVPTGSTLTNIGPGAEEQIKNEMEFHTNGEHGELKSYNASIGSQQNLAQLQSYLDTLNAHQGDPNFLSSGSGAEVRTDIAKLGNTAWGMAGGDPKEAPFDPNDLAAAQAAYKTANLLGMQLINSQFGASREAASVIQTGLKSVPSMENTPEGARLLLNGAKEVSNNTVDRFTFKEWWSRADGPHPGDLRGADVAFNREFPPQLYARRAISQENPIDISGLKQMPNLLPGTVIRYGNSAPKIIPQTKQYPFQLPSINGGTQ